MHGRAHRLLSCAAGSCFRALRAHAINGAWVHETAVLRSLQQSATLVRADAQSIARLTLHSHASHDASLSSTHTQTPSPRHTQHTTQVDNILPTGNVGKKRRAFSSACIFFHGVGLFGVGAYYVAQPSESLALIADAWGVSLDGPKKKTPEQQAVHVLAKNLVMVAAVYLAVWGATCMTLATAALPRTKKMVAGLNLVAATVTAVCSSFHPDAVASSACLVDRAAGVGCLKVAILWHAPFVVLDVLGIAFAEAGPRLVRINDRSAVLLHGNLAEELYHGKGTTILKINSHADLIKYADDGGIKSD